MSSRCTIDFETRSYADLGKVGAWVYSLHPSTEVICLCWKFSDSAEVGEWVPGMPPPASLIRWIRGGGLIEAHNYSFELAIWTNVCMPKYGFCSVLPSQWRCSMAVACYYALPAKLESLCRALHIEGKDPAGGRLISKYSCLYLKTASPTIPPEDLRRFIDYCKIDVLREEAVSDYLGDLPDRELPHFQLDQEINMRGLFLDAEGIAAAAAIVDQRAEALTDRFRTLTGLNPTQNAKLLPWFAARGLVLDNMQAAYIEDLLEEGAVPAGECREALTIRLQVNKASTKKLDAMARQRSPANGRALWQVRYHGAQTGRDTGGGFQPLNLTRGMEDVEPDQLVRDIMHGDATWLDALYGDAMDAVSKASRHWIMAAPGHRILAGDFVSIEAVVLACLAGETWKVDAFREGRKIYELMGDKIHGLAEGTVTKKSHPGERQDGKTCLGARTKVLTNRGWTAITNVKLNDMLWDGVEWVKHSGLASQGLKTTISWAGVEITEDHRVLCGSKWFAASAVNSRDALMRRAKATGSARLPSSVLNWGRTEVFSPSGSGAPAEAASTLSPRITYATAELRGAQSALKTHPWPGERISGVSLTFAPTTRIGDDCLIASPHASHAASPAATEITEREASSSMSLGSKASRESARIWPISCLYRAGMCQRLRSTASTMMSGISQVISGSLRAKKTTSTNGRSGSLSTKSPNLRPVYDLLNAGPRRRFTILTDAGPVIVHNCELAFGYQGGLGAWLKFDNSGRHTDERIVEICKAWRAEHPMIVKFWRGLDDAALKAVANPADGIVQFRSIGFEIVDEWLSMILPNGKRIWYREPELRTGLPAWHKPETKEDCAAGSCDCRPMTKLTYMAQKEGQWRRVNTYGGKLCVGENTLVLTSEGWKQITKIAPSDLVWDGEGWTTSDGPILQGIKPTMDLSGIRITPDHLVLTEEGWKHASQSERHKRAACRLPDSFGICGEQWSEVPVVGAVRLRRRDHDGGLRSTGAAATRHPSLVRLQAIGEHRRGQSDARNEHYAPVRGVAQHVGSLPAADAPGVAQLWRPRDLGLRALAGELREILGGHGADISQWPLDRANEQRGQLRTDELSLGYMGGAVVEQADERAHSDAERRDDGDRSGSPLRTEVEHLALSDQARLGRPCRVYDLLNAGPRRRFVVRDRDGQPVIIHNCENATQAVSREYLMPSVHAVKKAGYPVILKVYDEVVSEAPIGFGSKAEFIDILKNAPGRDWARTDDGQPWPIGVDAFESQRYKK